MDRLTTDSNDQLFGDEKLSTLDCSTNIYKMNLAKKSNSRRPASCIMTKDIKINEISYEKFSTPSEKEYTSESSGHKSTEKRSMGMMMGSGMNLNMAELTQAISRNKGTPISQKYPSQTEKKNSTPISSFKPKLDTSKHTPITKSVAIQEEKTFDKVKLKSLTDQSVRTPPKPDSLEFKSPKTIATSPKVEDTPKPKFEFQSSTPKTYVSPTSSFQSAHSHISPCNKSDIVKNSPFVKSETANCEDKRTPDKDSFPKQLIIKDDEKEITTKTCQDSTTTNASTSESKQSASIVNGANETQSFVNSSANEVKKADIETKITNQGEGITRKSVSNLKRREASIGTVNKKISLADDKRAEFLTQKKVETENKPLAKTSNRPIVSSIAKKFSFDGEDQFSKADTGKGCCKNSPLITNPKFNKNPFLMQDKDTKPEPQSISPKFTRRDRSKSNYDQNPIKSVTSLLKKFEVSPASDSQHSSNDSLKSKSKAEFAKT